MKLKRDRPWSDYPIGTKAHALGGGHWERVASGWKWLGGCTFPTPGGDAFWVTLPEVSGEKVAKGPADSRTTPDTTD